MRRFWEIKVHYERHSAIRTEIEERFEDAMRTVRLYDEPMQRHYLSQLAERWSAFTGRIGAVQAAVVASIASHDMPIGEKMPLLERELRELQLNVQSAKGVLRNQDELHLYIERLQVLQGRTKTVGAELSRISIPPSSAPPERIGDLFGLSVDVSKQIDEELRGAGEVLDRIGAIRDGIERMRKLQAADAVTLYECEASERLGSAEIELAVVECRAVAEQLVDRWKEIMELRNLLHRLPGGQLRMTVSPVKLEHEIARLQDDHVVLESRCDNVLGILLERLKLWQRFEGRLEEVQQSVQETDYMVELLRVDGHIDYERLRQATERLEVGGFETFERHVSARARARIFN